MRYKGKCDQIATLSTWTFFHCFISEHIAVYPRIHYNTIRNQTGTEGVNVNSIAVFTMD